jgi:hypothetical protein
VRVTEAVGDLPRRLAQVAEPGGNGPAGRMRGHPGAWRRVPSNGRMSARELVARFWSAGAGRAKQQVAVSAGNPSSIRRNSVGSSDTPSRAWSPGISAFSRSISAVIGRAPAHRLLFGPQGLGNNAAGQWLGPPGQHRELFAQRVATTNLGEANALAHSTGAEGARPAVLWACTSVTRPTLSFKAAPSAVRLLLD